jgi:hypothetical protein
MVHAVISIPEDPSLLNRFTQTIDVITNSKVFQVAKVGVSWSLNGFIRYPWKIIALPHKVLEVIIPDLCPFKSLLIKLPSAFLAYYLYNQVQHIPFLGSTVHTIVPLASTAIVNITTPVANYVVQGAKDVIVNVAQNAFEELKKIVLKKLGL